MMRYWLVSAALFLAAAVQAFSQTAPDAVRGTWQADAGAGVSIFNGDFYGNGALEGVAIWVDVYPNRGPKLVRGVGLALEGRDLSFGGPEPGPTSPDTTREETYGGGVIYSWRHFRNLTPYGKFMWEFANIDFNVNVPNYMHDTRSLKAVGGGLNYRLGHDLSVRADYEMQFWQKLFEDNRFPNTTGIAINPAGVTLGVSYQFHRSRSREEGPGNQ